MAEQLCFSNILCATDGQLTSSDPNRLNKRHHFHCHLSGHETTANAAEAGCVEGDGEDAAKSPYVCLCHRDVVATCPSRCDGT